MTDHWVEQTGIILFTENYQACIAFYRDVIGLEVMFDKGSLTCMKFGTSYLMVETGGVGAATEKTFAQNPVTLRLNVADVESAAALLRDRGADITIHNWSWGTTALTLDPDGNRVELKNHFDGSFAPRRDD